MIIAVVDAVKAIVNVSPKKNSGLPTGFESMAFALQCSTGRAMKTLMLGADQFAEFIFTRDRNDM